MKQISIITLIFFLNIFSANAQETEKVLRVESVSYNGEKKDIDGKCFALSIVKTKMLYQVVVVNKSEIIGKKEIKVTLEQEKKKEPYIFTIQIESKDLIKSEKLIAIPFIIIREQLQNDNSNIVYPVFTLEDFIPRIMNGITEKDVEDLKQKMEKWIFQ